MRGTRGITLIALIVTIIVLLILAGVTIALVLNQGGIFGKANEAKQSHAEAQAEEQLSLALLELATDKYTKEEYNENEYIDKHLTEKEMVVTGDIVLVDGWKFQIDRSVPKISGRLGQGSLKEEIKLNLSSTTSSDYSKASIHIEVQYTGEVVSIEVGRESVTVPNKVDGKYTVDKEVTANGRYTVVVKDKDGAYQVGSIEIKGISEDMNIYNKADLEAFRDRVNKGATYEGRTIKLMSDIDLQRVNWTPIGTGTNFKGKMDGQNHTIRNLEIQSDLIYVGLFGIVEGEVSNIILESSSIKSTNLFVGGIAGRNQNGLIQNCKIKASTTIIMEKNSDANMSYVGGMIGFSQGNTIQCSNEGSIRVSITAKTQPALIGGIVGAMGNVAGARTENCYNQGTITSTYNITGSSSDIASHVGGIVGQARDGTIINQCYNMGTITSKGTSNAPSVGGIVGMLRTNYSKIQNCYNKGNLSYSSTNGSSSARVGGIVGLAMDDAIVENSYNIGNVGDKATAQYLGGCSGAHMNRSTLNNCYASLDIGTTLIVGANNNASVTNSAMKTREEIKGLTSTLGGSFTDDTSNVNGGFPILNWQK